MRGEKMGKKFNNLFEDKGSYYLMYDNRGNVCLIDKEDYEKISKGYWGKYQNSNYFCSNIEGKKYWLHRYIMNAQKGKYVDHINNNFDDYRKINLRICSNAENNRNRGLQKNNTSGYPGVNWVKREQKWRARIKVDGKEQHLGLFSDINDAIQAKKAAEEKYFKEFSYYYSQKGELKDVC